MALGGTLSFTAVASDVDIGQTLTLSLGAGAPAGATIHPSTGLFTWQPTSAQAPSTNLITVVVADNGSPALGASRAFTVVVKKPNTAPILAAIADQTVMSGSTLSFSAVASDADVPAQALTFSLGVGAAFP